MKRPTGPEFFIATATAALHNAYELAVDAKVLLAEGRYPRAYALGVLALEEFGKHVICTSAVSRLPSDLDYWVRFRGRYNSHQEKLRAALSLLGGLRADSMEGEWEALNRLAADAAAEHSRKLRGLYVDYDSRGAVLDPADVTAEEADAVVKSVGLLLRAFRTQWHDDRVDRVMKAAWDHAHQLDALIKRLGPGAAALITSELLQEELAKAGTRTPRPEAVEPADDEAEEG